MFGDEAILSLCLTLCRHWHHVGEQEKVETPGRSEGERWITFGAVSYVEGELTVVILERQRSEEFWELLRAVLHRYPGYEVVLVVDNLPIHGSKKTQKEVGPLLEEEGLKLLQGRGEYERLHLVFLPTYSPWLNPLERFWKELRRKVTHNYFFKGRTYAVGTSS